MRAIDGKGVKRKFIFQHSVLISIKRINKAALLDSSFRQEKIGFVDDRVIGFVTRDSGERRATF